MCLCLKQSFTTKESKSFLKVEKLDMVVHTYKASSEHTELKASLDYVVRPSQKLKQNTNPVSKQNL